MAKTKEQKAESLEKLNGVFKDSLSAVFVHFDGLQVGDETAMRNELRQEGVSYYVAKKTLMKKAAVDAGIKGDIPELEGEMAVAYSSEDPTAPARNIHSFVKKYNDAVKIVGGTYEGAFMDAIAMNEIATIPPLDTLRGMFANVINSPIQRFVVALGQVAEKKA